MRYDSPLRYPGGKAALAPFLGEIIARNGLADCSYFEPFAGGAGAALRLLREGVVSEIHINDLDPCIAAFWRAVLAEPERFADAVASAKLNVREWERQRQIYRDRDTGRPFDLGFATFYLNRCNRSGVLSGATPTGGYRQTGKWKLDARYYRERLAERVNEISRRAEQIHVSDLDARRFLVERLPRGRARRRVFAYLDPPDWDKGRRLCLNSCSPRGSQGAGPVHVGPEDVASGRVLRRHAVRQGTPCRAHDTRHGLSLKYNLQRAREAQELLIAPSHVTLPECRTETAHAWITTDER